MTRRMVMLQYLISCWLAARFVSATCSASTPLIIRSAADASSLSTCTSYTGDIAMATAATGTINLPKIESIKGNLIVGDAPSITGLQADSLSRIDGQFMVTNLSILSTLTFPKLSQLTDLVLDELPNLSQLGIDIQNATNVFIGRNGLLQNITLHTQTIQQNLTIASNGNSLHSISLPDLTVIGGSLNIACNTRLATLSFPSLSNIGGVMDIQGNTPLHKLEWPALHELVGGAMVKEDISTGSVTTPVLDQSGGPRMVDDSSISCDSFLHYNIESSVSLDSIAASSSSTSELNNSNSPHNLSTGTTVGIALGIGLGLAVVVLVAFCRSSRGRRLRVKKAIEQERDKEEAYTIEKHEESEEDKTIYVASKDHKSVNFLPVELPTEISPSRPQFDTTEPSGTRTCKDAVKPEERETETRREIALGQDLSAEERIPALRQAIEMERPNERVDSARSSNPTTPRHSLIPPQPEVPTWAKQMCTTTPPPKLRLNTRSIATMSSQPPKLSLHLGCSSAGSSRESLTEDLDCAVAESSQLQRLRPAIVQVRTPSPRQSQFCALAEGDPRLRGLIEGDANGKQKL